MDFLAVFGLLWVIHRCHSFLFSTLPSLLSSKRHWENTRLPLPYAPNTSSPHPCISQSSPCSCSQLNSPGSLPSPASLIRPPIPSPFAFAGHGSGYSPFHSCFLKFKFLLAVRFSTNLQRCCYFSWLNKFFLDLTFPSSYLSLLSSLYSKKNLKPYLYSLTVSNFFPWFHRNHS